MEVARKRAEAETRAVEIAEKLRKEREILECKRQQEEKMMNWVCKFFHPKLYICVSKYILIYSA